MTEFSNFSVVAFDESMPFFWAYRAILLIIYYLMFLEVIFKNIACIILKICRFPFATKTTASLLQDDGKKLNKLPQHLAIVINEDQISFSDIAKIIVWCITLNITCITVHDMKGLCKKNLSVLEHEIYKENTQFASNQYTNIRFLTDSKGGINGAGSSQSLVRLLSVDDGRPNLSEVTRQICQKVNHNQMKLQDVTVDNVDKLLRDGEGLSDPDLAIVFGPGHSLMGFRPWQLRLTEILFAESHRNLEYRTFQGFLSSFDRTIQRCGK